MRGSFICNKFSSFRSKYTIDARVSKFQCGSELKTFSSPEKLITIFTCKGFKLLILGGGGGGG